MDAPEPARPADEPADARAPGRFAPFGTLLWFAGAAWAVNLLYPLLMLAALAILSLAGADLRPFDRGSVEAWSTSEAGRPLYAAAAVAIRNVALLILALLPALPRGRGAFVRLGWTPVRGGLATTAWCVAGVAALDLAVVALRIGASASWGPLRGPIPAAFEAGADVPLALWLTPVLAASLFPAVAEETLFRGVLQRGLTRAWPPAAALALTAGLFALSHGGPVQVTTTLPLAIWLGWAAWRADSLLPVMLAHALNNALLGTLVHVTPAGAKVPAPWALFVAGALGVVAFVAVANAFERAVVSAGGRS